MSKVKSESVSSERYESLQMDNQAYMNMPEPVEYLNPIPSGTESKTMGAEGKLQGAEGKHSGVEGEPRALPLTPSHPTPSPPTPPPPKRDTSSSGKLSEENSPSAHKNSNSLRYPRMGNGFTSLERIPGKEKVLLSQKNAAFDSGVGDLEHVHIDGMNQNKNYDYADYGHQYEELPNRKSIAKCRMDSGIDSRSELYQSSGGATDIVSENGDTANIVNNRGEKRKRVNPLYDAMTQSMPSIYNKKSADDESLRQQVRCLKCALVVLFVLTFAAIAVSVFAVVTYNQTKDDPDPLLTPKVQKLTQDYTRLEELLSSFDDNNNTMKVLSDLIQKVNVIDRNMSTQVAGLERQIADSARNTETNTEDIADRHANISSVISFLNMTIQLQLHNLSKQEGPRGPQGVANFSKCSYYNVSGNAVASDTFPSYSPWMPTETDLERNIAIFASCSVDGGIHEQLEVHAITDQTVQYRCKCSGIIEGKSRRICVVHILGCPRQS